MRPGLDRADLRARAAGDVLQGVESIFDLDYNGAPAGPITYGQVFRRAEREFSTYNFELADTALSGRAFRRCREGVPRCWSSAALALPAYDQCLKASHLFNLLDARGAISVTERAAYILRVRALAKACCETWLAGAGWNSR